MKEQIKEELLKVLPEKITELYPSHPLVKERGKVVAELTANVHNETLSASADALALRVASKQEIGEAINARTMYEKEQIDWLVHVIQLKYFLIKKEGE